MSIRCKNSAGGSEASSPSILEESSPSSSAAVKVSKSGYQSRLRPRPTRQTEYFRSPVLKRKIVSSKDLLPQHSISEPTLSRNVAVPAVRQTRASFLREKANLASASEVQTTSHPEKRHLNSSEHTLSAKRSRSKVAFTSTTKKNPRKAVSQESLHRTQEATKVKEVQSKLWYPFIPPGTSSESEEEENFHQVVGSASATSGSARKLASRSKSSKSSSKESGALPSTSTSKLSSHSESKGQPKPSASKSTGRFSLGRFSKSESAKAETTKEGSNSQSSVQPSSSSQSGVRTRSTISKHSKSAKGKSSSKSRDEESKSKSRKRYQSPPNHPLYSRSSFTPSTKTGSCASASRRGRGKASSGNTREQAEPSPAVPVMSRDAARSTEDEQVNVSEDPAADNQGDLSAAPAAPVDNSSSPDAEFDDPDMSRFQALLEARGLPTHFFGTLGPRVQQIFNRSMNNGRSSKAQLLLQGMQATGDESCQLQSVIEMCQLLVMGNEDTLSGFPTKMVVPALITLLKMEHNFDMMNHACRALTYMMEALPRSASVVVDAVPAFLEKLQSIQCMDVAEQSLTALEMLSRRHGASILRASGLSSCLLYLDFFSLPAQRNALTVAANCCSVLTPSDQHSEFDKYYGSSISLLAQRLSHHDKKCVESICLCFARLVDNFHNQPEILQKIANDGLLKNFQNLLVVTPPLIGSNTFVMVIRTMSLLCSSCPDLATQLVKHNIADTLRYLLCGTATDNEDIELIPRGPQELYEITSLIGELMPRLPLDDPMFSVDRLLKQSSKKPDHHHPIWQWRGDEGTWYPYSKHDNRMIEEAHRSGDHEASLLIQSRVYMLDFTMMQQINEDTGNSRAIRRQTDTKEQNKPTVVKTESDNSMADARVSLVKDDSVVISEFVRSLFTVLYEVYGSSAGSPAVRHKCLRAVQRMIYYAEPELLRDVLRNLSVSSHIASMLSSSDLKVIVGALQMAMILMNKLPEVFEVYFRRQGVTHQVEQLLDKNHKVVGIDRGGSPLAGSTDQPPSNATTPVFEGAPSSTDPSPSDPSTGRLSDILRRKYPPRKNAGKRLSSSSSLTPTPEDHRQVSGRHRSDLSSPTDRVISPPLTKAKAFAAAMSIADGASDTPTGPKSKPGGNSRSSASSFFFNLNPTRWRRSFPSSASVSASPATASHVQSLMALTSSSSQAGRIMRENLTLPNLQKNTGSKENKEQVKQWVREQAKLFLDKYFALEDISEQSSNEGPTEDASFIKQLTNIAQSLLSSATISDACDTLRAFCDIISTSDVSSFELQHSGIVTSLIAFLTQEAEQTNKKTDSSKRKSVSTPPMTTRRRSKPDSGAQTPEIERVSSMEHDRPGTAPSTDVSHLTRRSLKVHGDDASQTEASGADTAKKSSKWNAPFISLDKDERLRHFLNVFVGLPSTLFSSNLISASDMNDAEPLRNLVLKLNLCINQLEQFSVKFQDLPSAPGRGVQALNFFSRHQLKCRLQRSPNCNKSKQWYGGPVRVDPLALVQAIERHLISRGYGAASSSDGSDTPQRRDALMMMGDDDDSEDEIEVDDEDVGAQDLPTGGSTQEQSSSPSPNKHRLELYLGTNKLPYNMTVYQAVKHFSENCTQSSAIIMSSSDRDTDDESLSLSNASIWSEVHTIHYKLVPDTATSSSATTASGKKETQKISPKLSKKQDSLFQHGVVPALPRPLDKYLVDHLPPSFVTSDPSKEVLCLLRIVFGLTIHWHSLYDPSALKNDRELISKSDFVNSKLSTKAHRQLQDPLMIMTGDLPPWLSELTHSCPFVLPFETRQLFFRIVSFDRDRAMQYLLDTGALPELTSPASGAASSSHDAANHFVPKIDKKKCTVKRENLLQQAEKLLHDHGNARSLLEIQYEGEVGTGLGPTLEFYTLASHELQRADLSLWRSDEKSSSVENSRNAGPTSLKKMVKKLTEIVDSEEVAPMPLETSFVHSPVGLYPQPIGRTTKLSSIAKPKSKFTFLGKFLAKSAMDGRLADIPLSIVCYKWLLGKENEITWFDLEQVDPGFTLTFNKLKNVLHQRTILENEAPADIEEKRASITMDGCSLEDLGLDFLLPGFPNIELMKGGTKTSLSISNIDKYLSLIAHWTLIEGVRHQLDALKEGFHSVFSLQTIDYFFPEELDELFCGARYQPWSERELADCCRTDHGYNHDSEAVRTLLRVLSQYDVAEQRAFLQFVTGSPHLPVGGFKALHPQLTIVRKSSEEGHSPDEYLPSVMTCVNYLKLPEYSSEAIMRQRLCKATREGQKSFLLS